jgi:hypothetical protein
MFLGLFSFGIAIDETITGLVFCVVSCSAFDRQLAHTRKNKALELTRELLTEVLNLFGFVVDVIESRFWHWEISIVKWMETLPQPAAKTQANNYGLFGFFDGHICCVFCFVSWGAYEAFLVSPLKTSDANYRKSDTYKGVSLHRLEWQLWLFPHWRKNASFYNFQSVSGDVISLLTYHRLSCVLIKISYRSAIVDIFE